VKTEGVNNSESEQKIKENEKQANLIFQSKDRIIKTGKYKVT